MSLVISLHVNDDFWIGSQRYRVAEIEDANRFWVQRAGESNVTAITDDQSVEIEPDVFLSSGGFFKFGMIRLVVEAPRVIEVLRGDRWRERYGGSREHA